ncbi:solute carrier family 25 member 46 isoform X1 [Drosophila guanche]|uniref:Blast:Solute carrier family 25 member 46 n=1 Tax=Drosophila guanche TaxID=7266 RepID=A0A3B0K191_DROGU|nr:solute carrier family 25 member 46 isoform X1 [Drosophila guanche]SPP86442.1 blast:Solute carrier family 25 member 46 [Drosophila guanche]
MSGINTYSTFVANRGHLDDQMQRENQSIVDQINAEQDVFNKIQYADSQGEFILPIKEHKGLDKYMYNQEDDTSLRKYLVFGVQWISLVTENLLSHPFIVLRRQCQVYNASKRYHLHPFTLLPSIVHLHRRQGLTTLWKGLGSCLLVRGMGLAVDDVISKLTSWPKGVNSNTTLKRFGQHVLLKCISIALVVPFHAASLVETVQSDIASEKPGLFDVFREGSLRLFFWSYLQKGRMLPAWALIGPSVSLGVTKYLFNLVIRGVSSRIMLRKQSQMQENVGSKSCDDTLEHTNLEIYGNLIATLTTEVIFFPFETILHRIQLQGTRTIIDNLDNGYAVVPILTNYQGAVDCYQTTIISEGFGGLYKGFGAMVLQFAVHIAVIKMAKWIVTKITEGISNRPPPCIVQYYNLDCVAGKSSSTALSSSISSTEVDAPIEERML